MLQGANLFVYGIPESYGDQDLSTLFATFGTVLNAKVYRDLTTGTTGELQLWSLSRGMLLVLTCSTCLLSPCH
jgi:hypothetical protein